MIFLIYLGDCIEVMKKLEQESVEMVFADPPYFLSNGGISYNSGKIVSVNKGEWDKRENYISTDDFTLSWISECKRVLNKNGTIWITGTHHNIFDVYKSLKTLGFSIINLIVWEKTDPPPLVYKNKFRFSHELIIWAKKGKSHYFNYDGIYSVENIEMTDVWKIPAVQMSEKKYGNHPTQKPEKLLTRVIMASTNPQDTVLDPFMGSGTTGVVAKTMGRKFIGIELENKYFALAKRRIEG